MFRARGLCHPAGLGGSNGVFVPNDIVLGGDAKPFVVLTGTGVKGCCGLAGWVGWWEGAPLHSYLHAPPCDAGSAAAGP